MSSRPARGARTRKEPGNAILAKKAIVGDGSIPDGALQSTFIEPERRRGLIAEAAYYRAEQRGFEPGHEIEDWCAAEIEIDNYLALGETPLLGGGRSNGAR